MVEIELPGANPPNANPPGAETPRRKNRGGRPKSNPADLRAVTIGVRVSENEYAELKVKAEQMGMTPARFLREAALSRRLPNPLVNREYREHYAELARLAANLNQLTRMGNEGRRVAVSDVLLRQLYEEVKHLRMVIIAATRSNK